MTQSASIIRFPQAPTGRFANTDQEVVDFIVRKLVGKRCGSTLITYSKAVSIAHSFLRYADAAARQPEVSHG